MQTHHNRRLFDLAQRNAQRIALDQFCLMTAATLPAFCRLSRSVIFHPETPAEVALAYARNAQAHQLSAAEVTAVCCKLQTTSHQKVLNWLACEVPRLPDDDYLVSLGYANGCEFDSEPVWITSLPVFRIGRADLIQSLAGLLALDLAQLAVIGIRTSAVLVLDSYMGNLEHERSDDETVYELSRLDGESRC